LPAVFQQGGNSMVWLVDRATMVVRAQRVEVAGADGNLVLIGGGLMPGQVVVTAGVHALTEGQKVRWYVEPGAPALTAVAASSVVAATGASAASR
jgi:multidrug efflux pump subunit AcrA (membrane-fusion protein)